MFYGTETGATTKKGLDANGVRMLRWMIRVTQKDKIDNECSWSDDYIRQNERKTIEVVWACGTWKKKMKTNLNVDGCCRHSTENGGTGKEEADHRIR